MNGNDWFMRSYDASGNLRWAKTYDSGSSQDDEPTHIKLNGNGSYLYICGYKITSSQGSDVVLMKERTSDGEYVTAGWTTSWNSSNNLVDEGYSLDLDGSENIYVAGKTQITSTNVDALILKFAPGSGALSNVTSWNNNGNEDYFNSIQVVGTTPSVYVSGSTTTSSINSDYVVAKYNSTLSTQNWVNYFNGPGCIPCNDYHDFSFQLKYSSTTDKVYVTGWITGTSPESNNWGTARFNGSTGTLEWSDNYDRNSTDNRPASKYPMDIEYDPCHNTDFIYVTGYTKESSLGNYDATTIKYGLTGLCDGPDPGGRIKADNENDFMLTPNPFSNKTIFHSNAAYENSHFIIFDLTGRIITDILNHSQDLEIDLSGFSPGIYLYKFIQGETLLNTGKLILSE